MRLTLAVLYNDKEVLLAKKLKGKFGVGKWNGYGGFIEEGETPEQAAYREVAEESGITRDQLGQELQLAGLTRFIVPGESEPREVYLFRHATFAGQPTTTEGGKFEHRRFAPKDIPFEEMFGADKVWLPRFLNGENLEWDFLYKDKEFKEYEVLDERPWQPEGMDFRRVH